SEWDRACPLRYRHRNMVKQPATPAPLSAQPAHRPTLSSLSQIGVCCLRHRTVDATHTLNFVVVSPRPISTGHLNTPYRASSSGLSTPSSIGGLNHFKVVRNLILEQASRLDAF